MRTNYIECGNFGYSPHSVCCVKVMVIKEQYCPILGPLFGIGDEMKSDQHNIAS